MGASIATTPRHYKYKCLNFTAFKNGTVLATEANHTKPRRTLVADGVSRVMGLGGGPPANESGQTRVR